MTNEKQIQVDWIALTTVEEIGNSEILSYQLVWDSNSGTTNIIASQNLELTKVLIGLTRGSDYIFKIRAQNIYGYGEFSDMVTVRASSVPDTMLMIESISVMETVSISWTAPYNGGESIDQYEVQLLTYDNTFVNDD